MAEVILDPTLGRLVWSDCGDWYEGEAEVTAGRPALLFVCPEHGEAGGPAAITTAARTLARLRQHEGELRRRAAEVLAERDPARLGSLGVAEAAAALWVGCVYFWDDGGARVDWDDDAWLLNGESTNWVSHVDPDDRCTKVAWEHE